MATPEQLRADAELLRRVATNLRTKAAALDDDVAAVQTHYASKRDTTWKGPAADQFFTQLGTVSDNLGKIKTDVDTYADSCVTKAGELERQADTLEKQQADDAPK
jgi:uncharacterized protein YukE